MNSLRKGEVGKPILDMQDALSKLGYAISIDGSFGPSTERAVKQFQSDQGLTPDGIAGDETLELLGTVESVEDSCSPKDELESRISTALEACDVSSSVANKWCGPLADTCSEFSIDTVNRLSGFVSNLVHESAGLTKLLENLNYSEQSLRANWPTRFAGTLASDHGRNQWHPADQRMIAILAYGGRMGNQPIPSEDGWVYRGRGPIQLTGRSNYIAFSNDSEFDVVSDPDLLIDPRVGACSAGWFWNSNNCNKFCDANDIRGLRKKINGGVLGLEEVIHLFEKCKSVFQ